jgi:Mycothiol maleylpyruvate isomerase N-terminal domain
MASRIGQGFVETAAISVGLLNDPAVAAAWDRPSALEKFSVSGLAGHLARQVSRAKGVVTGEAPGDDVPRFALTDHYARAKWLGAPLDNDANAGIREDGEAEAAGGVAALVADTTRALDEVRIAIADKPGDMLVTLPWVPSAMTLDDFLTTRLLEMAVHSDDLAFSVGLETPELPPYVTDVVLDLLCRLSTRRHGVVSVMRAFSRAERAPSSIAAI